MQKKNETFSEKKFLPVECVFSMLTSSYLPLQPAIHISVLECDVCVGEKMEEDVGISGKT